MPSAQDLDRLARYGSATVYEVAGEVTPLDPGIRALASSNRVAGPALTIRCAHRDNLALHRAIAEAAEGAFLVVDAGGDAAGYFGEILTVAAMSRGLAGLVIDGGVRDTQAIIQRGFPVWSRYVAIGKCVKVDPGDVGDRVTVGGVEVSPGDVVVADADGIVVIPSGQVADVLEAAERRSASENAMFERLRAGETTIDLLGLRDRLKT